MPQLTSALRENVIRRLSEWPGMVFAVLYGSAVDGEQYRDLDIGVWVDRAAVPPQRDIDYAFDLMDALAPLSPVPVDVRVINDAPLAFRYNVSRGQALVVNDPAAWYAFLERTWDEWWDFEPVAMRYLRDLACRP